MPHEPHAAPSIWVQAPPPPRQRQLGREEIVAAAIALADETGPGGLTMKAVAERLGPYSPMALYRYVYSKDGLVDLMLDTVTGEVAIPALPGLDWRSDLHDLAAATRSMIARHPWYVAFVHTRPPVGPHMMRRVEFMLAVLVGQGTMVADAMTYSALIDRHVLGSGLQDIEEARSSREQGLDSAEAVQDAFAEVYNLAAKDGRFPHLASWLARPLGPTPGEQFDLGLAFLLDGIAARLPGPGRADLRKDD